MSPIGNTSGPNVGTRFARHCHLPTLQSMPAGRISPGHFRSIPVRKMTDSLNIHSVLSAMQALSDESDFTSLMNRALAILLDTSEAGRAIVLLERDGRLYVEGARERGQDTARVESVQVAESESIPGSVVLHTFRSGEEVTLHREETDPRFKSDAYLQKRMPATLLAWPLQQRGKVFGVLYLEHDDDPQAFARDRMETARILLPSLGSHLRSALRQAEIELQLQERTLQLIETEKMASLGRMVAGVAHEINTPLGIGVTAASTLLDETRGSRENWDMGDLSPDDVQSYLDIAVDSSRLILTNLNRAAQLVQGLKQVAVDQASQERRNFRVIPYMREILHSMGPRLNTTGHRVTLEGDDSVSMHSYPGPLSQIITNLINNTLEHAYEPGQSGHSHILVKEQDQYVTITYSDDGRGIPPENRERVFDPFFTTSRASNGSGLGLHIVSDLISGGLNGSIKLENPNTGGVVFYMELPRTMAETRNDR